MTVLNYNAAGAMEPDFSRLPRWAKALGQAGMGTGSANIFLVGDSTTAGDGSANTGGINCRPGSYPPTFAASLAARGINISDGGFFSDQNVSANAGVTGPMYDPRLTWGAGWGTNTGSSLCGGPIFNTTTTTAMSFTPAAAFDKFDVYIFTQAGTAGLASVSIDGGPSLGTMDTNQSSAYTRVSFTCNLGLHTVNVTRVSGTSYIFGMMTYNSTAAGLRMFQLGHAAATAANFTASAWPNYNLPAFLSLATPALTVLNIGINDWLNGTSLTAFSASMQSVISAALSVGDVVLVSPVPSAVSVCSAATQNSYVNALYALAVSNNIAFLDLHNRWSGGWEQLNPLGYYWDQFHPLTAGYNDVAGFLARSLALFSSLLNPGVTPASVSATSTISALIFG